MLHKPWHSLLSETPAYINNCVGRATRYRHSAKFHVKRHAYCNVAIGRLPPCRWAIYVYAASSYNRFPRYPNPIFWRPAQFRTKNQGKS